MLTSRYRLQRCERIGVLASIALAMLLVVLTRSAQAHPGGAADDAPLPSAGDESTESEGDYEEYTRKTVVWTGVEVLDVDDAHRERIAQMATIVRESVYLPRFDVVRDLPWRNEWDLEAFALAFRTHYEQHADAIAAARDQSELYTWTYDDVVFDLRDVERLLDSACVFQLIVEEIEFVEGPEWSVYVNARLQFYKINMTGTPVLTRLTDAVIDLSGRNAGLASGHPSSAADGLNEYLRRLPFRIEEALQSMFRVHGHPRPTITSERGATLDLRFPRGMGARTGMDVEFYGVKEGGRYETLGFGRIRAITPLTDEDDTRPSHHAEEIWELELLAELGRGVAVGDFVEERSRVGLRFGIAGGFGLFSNEAVSGGGATVNASSVLGGGGFALAFDLGSVIEMPELWVGLAGFAFASDGGMTLAFGGELTVGTTIYNAFGPIGLGFSPSLGVGIARLTFATDGGDITSITQPRNGTNLPTGQREAYKEVWYARLGFALTLFLLIDTQPAELFLRVDLRVLSDNSDIVSRDGRSAYLPGLNPALIVPTLQLGFRLQF